MNGAATKKGKFSGKVFKVNRGIKKGKLPIKICRSLRDALLDNAKSLEVFPDRTMQTET